MPPVTVVYATATTPTTTSSATAPAEVIPRGAPHTGVGGASHSGNSVLVVLRRSGAGRSGPGDGHGHPHPVLSLRV